MAGIFAVTAVLVGCVAVVRETGLIGRIGAVSDVARATDTGLEVLNDNGSAADAVVAMAFMMVVERPDQVGLAGGGTCLVFDPEEKATRLLDFPAEPASGGAVGVPGFLRGLAAIHADYGRLRWSEMVAIAETSLRLAPPGADSTGRSAGERLALADSLAAIRNGGVQAFYEGELGRRYANAVAADGLPLSIEQIQSSRLIWQEPATASFRNDLVSFGPATGGRNVRLVEAFVAAENGQQLPGGGSTGSGLIAAAFSPDETAVICGFGFNPVGGGAVAGDTGIPIGAPTSALPSIAIHYNEPVAIPIDMAGSTEGANRFAVAMLAAAERGLALDSSDPGGRLTGLLCQWDRSDGRECRGVADPAQGGYGLSTEIMLP